MGTEPGPGARAQVPTRARVPAPRLVVPRAWTREPSRRRRPRPTHPARRLNSPLLRHRRRRPSPLGITTTTMATTSPSSRSSKTVARMGTPAVEVRRRRRPGTLVPRGPCAAGTTRGARPTARTCTSDSSVISFIIVIVLVSLWPESSSFSPFIYISSLRPHSFSI